MYKFPFSSVGYAQTKSALRKPLPTYSTIWLWWGTEAKLARKSRTAPRHVRYQ